MRAASPMSNDNFYALVESRMPRDLGARFLETGDGTVYSWRDVQYASARLAGWLASLGVVRDDFPPRIAVQVEKSPEAVLLYLAALRAGFVYLPLNTAYQRGELEYFLDDAEPAVVVCSPGASGRGRADRARVGLRARHDARRATRRHAARRAARVSATSSARCRARRRTSRRSSTPRARPAAARARCSRHGNLAVQRAHARRVLGLQGRRESGGRRAAARAADVPRARPVRGAALRAAVGRHDAVPAEVRSAPGAGPAAARDGVHGRADVLHAPARRGRARPPRLPQHAPVRVGLGAAAAGDLRRVPQSAPATRSSSATACPRR